MSDQHALEKQVSECVHALKMVLDDYRFSQATRNSIFSNIDWSVERFFDELERVRKGKT